MDITALSKVAGYLVTASGLVYAGFKGFYGAVGFVHDTRNSFLETRDTVKLLATNHLPHIQESLNNQDVAIAGLRSNMRNLDTSLADHVKRFEDTKKSVDKINDALIDQAFTHKN